MSENNSTLTKKLNIWLPLLFSLVLTCGMLVGAKLKQTPQVIIKTTQNSDLMEYSKLGQGRIEDVIRFVEAKYVDDVNSDEMVEEAINNILKELDPHTNYITSAQLKKVNEDLEGNFDGIGIEFIILDDTIVVVSPLSGGPSEKVGVLAGDKIVEIGDSLIADMAGDARTHVNKLRGEKGTRVEVGVVRNDAAEIHRYTITRDEIPNYSVDVGYMLDERTGYIKINRFSATTFKEFMEKLEVLIEEKQMKDLVIDLRQNPGGYLQEATKILSQFFQERGKLLVYTEGRTVRRNEYETTGTNYFDVEKIAVLIDEGSASASEIVAGAVQDWDRGVIVGRRSFGKGLVQEQYELKDGSALRLTVARYFTPSGRLIQKNYSDKAAYDSDVIQRFSGGELLSEDSIPISDTTRYFTLVENRTVYGGGGITPDVFIPMDTTLLNHYYLKLRSVMPQYIYRFLENHDNDFEEMTLAEFRDNYRVSDEMMEEFITYSETKEISRKSKDLKKVNQNVKLMLKSELARRLFEIEGFFTVWNDADESVKAALRALKTDNPLTYSQ